MQPTRIYITADLGFGDSGKGTLSDHLVTQCHATAIVRYTGGPQAAHHVVSPEGYSHGFCQFGSTFDPRTHTHLARNFMVKPQNLLTEERMLAQKRLPDAFTRLSIDPRCCIVTPFHAMVGQLLERARGQNRFGSVGMGVGQALLDRRTKGDEALRLCDAFDEQILRDKLQRHYQEKMQQAEEILTDHPKLALQELVQRFRTEVALERLVKIYQFFVYRLPIRFVPDEDAIPELLSQHKAIVFEGAHGALLDFEYGFWPYVTKTETTVKPTELLLAYQEHPAEITRIGLVRAYNYRHGAGPFVTEDDALKIRLPQEIHNSANEWQGDIRVGWFDLLATRYSVLMNGSIDWLALTMLDKLAQLEEFKACIAYEYIGARTDLHRLDDYFHWDYVDGQRIRVTGLKLVKNQQSDQFAQLLFNCRPFEFLELSGKPADISQAKQRADLPDLLLEFIRFLESPQGVGLPIKIISVGPTAQEKIFQDE